MRNLQEYIDSQLSRGRGYFTKEAALAEAGLSTSALQAGIGRAIRKGAILSPRRGFYLILRPEDRQLGAPDPSCWIDPLMKHQGLDYRISLLRAAAFHGSSHQAAMVFQVIAHKQLPKIVLGRQRVEFLYQSKAAFVQANNPKWLLKFKTEAGFAQIAGLELTLLDICRYFHKAAGINGAAQAVHDLGKYVNPRILAKAASAYENSAVRRLGYLLEHFGHNRQAQALKFFAMKAKSFKALDPAVKSLVPELGVLDEKNQDWKLIINVPIEIEA